MPPERNPFFEAKHLPNPKEKYVSWVDIMGTSQLMRRSVTVSSVNICKLYLYVVTSPRYADVDLFPMGDGVFIVGDELKAVQALLRDVFSSLAGAQIRKYESDELTEPYLSVIKATVTRGEVMDGGEISQTELANHEFRQNLVFGEPIAIGHRLEDKAPPFGVFLHESATDATDEVWQWWESRELSRLLWGVLKKYYDYHENDSKYGYSPKKIKQHREEAREYLTE